jgi:hypothetical protein
LDQVPSFKVSDAARRSTRTLDDPDVVMRSLIQIVVTIAAMAAVAVWGWWAYATPVVLEARSGTLAGFAIGQSKQELLLQHAKSLTRLWPASENAGLLDSTTRQESLLRAESWEADVAVAECPVDKRCPATTLQFGGDRLSAILVKCHSCP